MGNRCLKRDALWTSRFSQLVAHDLSGKPLHTFPDHAPWKRWKIKAIDARHDRGVDCAAFGLNIVEPIGAFDLRAGLCGNRY
jgi:hypothetical protein